MSGHDETSDEKAPEDPSSPSSEPVEAEALKAEQIKLGKRQAIEPWVWPDLDSYFVELRTKIRGFGTS